MSLVKEKILNAINWFRESRWAALYYQYHISEMIGIGSSFVMTIITFLPVITRGDSNQVPVALFFLEIMLIRLTLFIWYQKTKRKDNAKKMQAWMMLATAVIMLLTRSTYISAVVYQIVVNKKVIIVDYTFLAVAYGIYSFGKIIVAIYGLIQRRKLNRYWETLSYLGWICAVYTLALFVNYLLHATQTPNLLWMKGGVILLMALSTIVLILIMLVKSLHSLITIRRERRKNEMLSKEPTE